MLEKMIGVAIICAVLVNCANCDKYAFSENEERKVAQELGKELVEQGRTLVHHAMKRFMIILPAIFFKLGIAFTMLLLVTIVAVNNGFIGFMILVVGLSSVLARLQEARPKPVAVPVPFAHYAPHYSHAHLHGWDRKDDHESTKLIGKTGQQYSEYATPAGYHDGSKYTGYTSYNYGRR